MWPQNIVVEAGGLNMEFSVQDRPGCGEREESLYNAGRAGNGVDLSSATH